MTNQERGLRWWQLIFQSRQDEHQEKKRKLEEVLDSIAFLRAQALAHIESLRAQVNGEDMWFTCYKDKRDDPKKGGLNQ